MGRRKSVPVEGDLQSGDDGLGLARPVRGRAAIEHHVRRAQHRESVGDRDRDRAGPGAPVANRLSIQDSHAVA